MGQSEIRGARHSTAVITSPHTTREDVLKDHRDLPDLLSGGR